jgi:hypothetical protein
MPASLGLQKGLADFLSPDQLESLKKESPEIQQKVLDKYLPALELETQEIQNQIRTKHGLHRLTPTKSSLRFRPFFLASLLPIVLGWLLVSIFVSTFTWVRRGFQKGKS